MSESEAPPAMVVTARALTFSVSAVLGDPAKGDPNVVFQTHLNLGDSDDLLRADSDRVMALVERLSARAEIVRIESHIRQVKKIMAKDRLNETRRKNDYASQVNGVLKEIRTLEAQAAKVPAEDQAAFTASGRAGHYKMTPGGERRLEGLKKDAANLQSTIAGFDLQNDQAMMSHSDSQATWQDEIDDGMAAIARLTPTVEG